MEAFHSADPQKHLLLHRNSLSFILMNRYPYNAGHLLALPAREVSDFDELTEEEQAALFGAVIRGQNILKRAMQPEGFNVGFNIGSAAGAGIPKHLHAHIVPRWNGDTNFMPVVGETKILPQALEALYAQLLAVVSEEK
ncbi:MAG: HIT domain-containing protein [Puniceicoccales bacterium]|nr:HIT domain-containing protein [Puniceicoccales bacterium]